MYFFSGSIIASLLLATTTFVNANTDDTYPLTTINNQTDFCIFLPPQPGLEVAINEDNGIPFCVNQNAVPNATVFPTGKIDLPELARGVRTNKANLQVSLLQHTT